MTFAITPSMKDDRDELAGACGEEEGRRRPRADFPSEYRPKAVVVIIVGRELNIRGPRYEKMN